MADDLISDEMLKNAISIYVENNYNDYDIDLPFDISKKFETKMEKLIKNHKKTVFKLTYTRARKTACILVAILIMMCASLSVEAVSDAIANFFVKNFSNHAVITYQEPTKKKNEYPATIEKEYELEYVPKGYELIDSAKSEDHIVKLYLSTDKQIALSQYTKNSYKENIDNENSTIHYETIDNQKYLIHKVNDILQYTYIWDNGEYVFSVTANMNKKDMLDLCKSLKVKK